MRSLAKVNRLQFSAAAFVPSRQSSAWYDSWRRERMRTPTKAQIRDHIGASRVLGKFGFTKDAQHPTKRQHLGFADQMNTQFTQVVIPEPSDYPFPWDHDGHHRNAHLALVTLVQQHNHLDWTAEELMNMQKGRKGVASPAAVAAANQVLDVWRASQPQLGRWRDALHEILRYLIDLDELSLFTNSPVESDYEQLVKHPMWLMRIRDRVNAGAYDDPKLGWHRFKADCVLVYDNALAFYDPVSAKYHWNCAVRFKDIAMALAMPARPEDPKVRALALMQAQRMVQAAKHDPRMKETAPGEETFGERTYESHTDFLRATSLQHMPVEARVRILAALLVAAVVTFVLPLLVVPDSVVLLFGEDVVADAASESDAPAGRETPPKEATAPRTLLMEATRILAGAGSHPAAAVTYLLLHGMLSTLCAPLAVMLCCSAAGFRRFGARFALRTFGKAIPHREHVWLQRQMLARPTEMAADIMGRSSVGKFSTGHPGPGSW